MSETMVTWLTQEAYDRLKHELDELIANRPVIAAEINARREEGDLRENGVAAPGMVLTVRYESDDETETFLLATREEGSHGDLEVYSPGSPLGEALLGAKEGEIREYNLPNGGTMKVTLVRAEPFRG